MPPRPARLLLLALPLLTLACGGAPPAVAPLDVKVTIGAGGGFVVVGVPPGVWGPGHRLAVEGDPGAGDLALLVVTGQVGDVAEVAPVVERTNVDLRGRRVRSLAHGEQPQLGPFHAVIEERKAERVRLSRGAAHGVEVGTRYVVTDAAGQAVGLIEVVEVADMHAWAEIIDGQGRMAVLYEARLKPVAQRTPGADDELVVLVIAFGAEDEADGDDAEAGRTYSDKLAGALADEGAGWPGLRVKSLIAEQVWAVGDVAGHEQARAIGVRHGADLVVWGVARCGPDGCVLPRFTIVDPERLAGAERLGAQTPVDHDDMKLPPDAVPPEPLALAAALLGELAWRAPRYLDAVYYLDRALGAGVYRGLDDLEARFRLSRAAYNAGQWSRSRSEAAALAADATARGADVWAFNAEFELVQLDASQGDIPGARSRAREALDRARALHLRRVEAVALSWLGDLAQREGRLDDALKHLRASTAVSRDLRWYGQYANTMGTIADILQARGELDEALRIRREEELPVYERLGDVRERAVTMGKVADILQARGELDEALRIRREEQLPVYERLGDVRERAVTMGKVADILQARGELDEALRIRREEELPVYERLGDVRSRAVTMGKVADILQARGELDEALRIRREEQLPVYARLGDRRELLVGRTNLALNLVTRNKASDWGEARALLAQAYADAVAMRLPEAGQIRGIQQALGFVATDWGGIGAGLEPHDAGLRVTRVVDGGPAAGALAVGDVLTAVDGAPLAGASVADAVDRIRGPVGSPIRLRVRRGDAPEREVTLTRRRLNLGGPR